MASNNDSASIQCTKVPRFTEKDDCNAFYMDVPPDGSKLAVYGYNHTTAKTFIDLFTLRNCLDSKDISLSMTSQSYLSKEFTKRCCPSWSRRCVCLLDDTVLVTFCCDKIESYDTENGRLVNQRKCAGKATCMTAKDGRVYVGLLTGNDVIVFDWELNQINTITLKELERTDHPRELTVNNNKLFICTRHEKALRYNIKGDLEHAWKPLQHSNGAMSITVSEVNELIFILWRGDSGKRVVIVYSLHEDYSSLIGIHSLALFKVSGNSSRIRINNNVNRLFVLTTIGQVYEYHTDNIVSFENLLTLIELLLDKDECQKLLKYFGVPVGQGKIKKRGELANSLFQHLRKTGKLSTGDISLLLTACFNLAITKVQGAWSNYQQFLSSQLLRRSLRQLQFHEEQSDERSGLTYRPEETKNELDEQLLGCKRELDIAVEKMVQFKEILQSKEEEIEQLEIRLNATEDERRQLSNRLSTTEKELDETRSSFTAAKDELVKTQMNYAKESMALQEVLRQTRETLSKQAIISTASLEVEHTFSEGRETSAISIDQESATLAADYGRLMVDVAEDLTLDNVLKLAYVLRLPNSESDMLRRISLIETPGITLMNFMKKRNIINMYDVTNLQRALRQLHLHSTNTNHVVPYQQKVDPFQFEDNRSPYLVDWPDEEAEASKSNERNVPHEDRRNGESKEPQDDHVKGRLTEKIEREETPTSRQHILHPYIEHRIDYEGGTISLMGVCLSIPKDALSGDHVIAVTVIRDPDVHLPGSAKRSRMTPLIKLEPENIKFNKTARLTIPHSAIIPEPDRHSVVVFTGQQGGLQKDEITWREENSLKWKLEQENVSLDINTMGFIFVNLVNHHEMKQKHVFRVIPFIDGILDVKSDFVITVCFCKDNDDQYKLLLEEFKSKLTLGDYTTFQVSRALNDGRDTVPCLDLVMSPQGGSYHLNKEEAKQVVDIDHLCAASRVSHQFRLKRTRTGNIDMIDVKLKLSQGDENQKALTLQSHVKNLLLSPESQGLLHGEMTRDSQQYENLKTTVSGLLSRDHCEKLAVFFDLTPAERDTVLNDVRPGMVLMKILDERELIMPNKMIGLYEGLKASHLNKIARNVVEYIDASQKKDVMKSDVAEDEQKKILWKSPNEEEKSPQEGQFLQLTRNVKRLMEEGFNRIDAQRALKLSHGKLDLGRRLLLLAKDEHERLPLFPGSTLYKEQYIDENGGEMDISGVHLLVPAGALHVGRIVSLMVSADPAINGPISNKSLRLTPFVKFGPDGIELHKPVIMYIPHCALIASGQTYMYSTHMYSGVLQKDKTIKWNLEWEQFSCSMNSHQLEVKIQKHCLIGPHIPYQTKMRKRIGVVPIINRPSSLDDEPTISLWFYNDDKLEHESLINEEVYNNNGIEIYRPVSIQLESMNSTFYVNISSSTQQCSAYPRRVDVAMNALWLQNRHKVVFQLQNTGRQDIVNLEIEGKAGLLKNLFRFSLQVKLKDLQNSVQITSPFQYIVPKFIVESFQQLNQKLSGHLNAEESTQLANIFQLPEDVITSMQIQRKPGHLLLKALTNKSLVTPANISSLESALTEQGNEECAKFVRDFRKNNPLVKATMCQEEKL